MAPRTIPLPSAQTESARELRRAFFCELCQKGYARITEFEAHEGSYDHQHRKRLKDMKALTRNPTAAVKASRETKRKHERGEMISINLQADTTGGKEMGRGPGRSDRPIGWPAETAKGETAREETAREGSGAGMAEGAEEEKWEDRPLDWDELDQLDSVLDMEVNRPHSMQRVADGQIEYLKRRADAGIDADVWSRVRDIRSRWTEGHVGA